ncbi:hypothetical protein F5148DRAFT_976610 [Russula earlei]|uniref:Uncharacterized protein n=1 Tax=Russula earlei TaxID=71964 RepID=A0ACC0UGZ6_9AGAM|nr:hypothetical protein F5148DRAFT_976610 [Russula earlei]
MNNGPSIFSDPSGHNLPDKPLVVKCTYRTTRKKLTFQSARNCVYDVFQEKIEDCFELGVPFTIRWQDQDKELWVINNESSLNDAIDYYNSGGDGSIISGSASRNSSRHHRITMHVEIWTEYDGPSLSDTASLASREEDSPEGSQTSFIPGELSASSQDDDAVTVSSKGMRALRQGRSDSSLIRKIWSGTSRAGSSSTPDKPPMKQSRSRRFNFNSRPTSIEEKTAESTNGDGRVDGSNHSSLSDTETSLPGVFEQLRLQEESHSLTHQRSMLETELGKTWLQDQSVLPIKATPRASPSINNDSFSLNTDTPLSDRNPNMDIFLQRDERGKYYYAYTGSGSSDSAGDLEYEIVNVMPSSRPQYIPIIGPFLNFTLAGNNIGIQDLLVPEEVTDCSGCGCVLDQIKYICTTCGEKEPQSRAALAAAAADLGMGRGRASPDCYHHKNTTEHKLQEPAYPPRAHRSPDVSYTNVPDPLAHPSNLKPLPALPSSSPTQTIFYRNFGSQSTLVPSSSSESSSPTTRVGYELCAMCFQKIGLHHALSGSVESPSSPTLPPTPQELAIARRSAPKRKGELRHAFLFQSWGSNGWQNIAEQEGISDQCSGCQSSLSGYRYRCAVCDGFPICRACYNDVHNIHPIHPFLEMRVTHPSQSHSHSERLNDDGTCDNADEPSLKHPGVQCFNCQQDIVGARFRCVDCTTIDLDICSNCETAGLPGNLDASDGGHNSSHIMLKIPIPLNMHQVQHVSQRAHGLRHGRDRADLRGGSPLTRSSPSSISSVSAGTVLYGNENLAEGEEDFVHLQVCNSCAEPIVGVRYQCLNCPSLPNSFNLCSDCEIKSHMVHDPMHIFLKIPRPVDMARPLESEFPIIPLLYRTPVGPPPGSPADTSGDPAAYLRDLTHAFALCDRDLRRIVGKWYRCAFCAKDLCADCEALDTHDNTHVFLVFKAPIDMQAFQHFADLENANGSPPVLRANIYLPRQD